MPRTDSSSSTRLQPYVLMFVVALAVRLAVIPFLYHEWMDPFVLEHWAFGRIARSIADSIARYAVNLVRATRATDPNAPDFIKKYVNFGASVRAAQFEPAAERRSRGVNIARGIPAVRRSGCHRT